MREKDIPSGSRFEVFEPSGSYAHDDRCSCPGCSGLCQDDYEFFTGTGQYASDAKDDQVREDQPASGSVECEACGVLFKPAEGYYEPDEYAYCKECCHW